MGPMYCLMQKRFSDEARAMSGSSCFEPEFADDTYLGGRCSDVLSRFKAELRCASKYGIAFEMGECTVYTLAGERFTGDLREFEEMGVKICRKPNIEMLKSPVTGDAEFMKEWCSKRGDQLELTLDAIADLPKAHTALHLLKSCASACKVVHLARTTPQAYIEPLLERFEASQKRAVETITGLSLNSEQWKQAQLPIIGRGDIDKGHAAAGLGLRSLKSTACSAYIS